MHSEKLLKVWEYFVLTMLCAGLVMAYDTWLTAGAPFDGAHSTLYTSAASVTLWAIYWLARLAPHVQFRPMVAPT